MPGLTFPNRFLRMASVYIHIPQDLRTPRRVGQFTVWRYLLTQSDFRASLIINRSTTSSRASCREECRQLDGWTCSGDHSSGELIEFGAQGWRHFSAPGTDVSQCVQDVVLSRIEVFILTWLETLVNPDIAELPTFEVARLARAAGELDGDDELPPLNEYPVIKSLS